MKILRTIFWFFAIVFSVILCVELGLFLREQKANTSQLGRSSQNSQKISILVIGDSVMGKEGISGTLATKIQDNLEKRLGQRLNFINRSEPAISTLQANQKIQRYISDDKPDVAVILLGLAINDFIVFSDSAQTLTRNSILEFLFKFRTTKLIYRFMQVTHKPNLKKKALRGLAPEMYISPQAVEKISQVKACFPEVNIDEKSADFIYSEVLACLKDNSIILDDLEVWYYLGSVFEQRNKLDQAIYSLSKCLTAGHRFPKTANRIIWQLYVKNDFEQMFNVFESMITTGSPTRRLMVLVRGEYLKQNQIQRGIAAFANFEKSTQPQHLKQFAVHLKQTLQSDFGIKNYGLHSEVKTYDEYYTLLYHYRITKQKELANDLYRKINEFEISEDSLPDRKSFIELVTKLQNANIKVFVVQYPNFPIWPIQQMADQFNSQFHLIDLQGRVLPQLAQYAAYELFEDDLLHTSSLGAEVFGKIISEEIIDKIGLKNAIN